MVSKLKWKKGLIKLCTPLLKAHDVLGYTHGQLAVHKRPGMNPLQWGITHIITGMDVMTHAGIAIMRFADVKSFAAELLESDTWHIEGAGWGVRGEPGRHKALQEILKRVLESHGYRVDTRKYSHADREVVRNMCQRCGALSDRYILSLDKKRKWEHLCTSCEPHNNERTSS